MTLGLHKLTSLGNELNTRVLHVPLLLDALALLNRIIIAKRLTDDRRVQSNHLLLGLRKSQRHRVQDLTSLLLVSLLLL